MLRMAHFVDVNTRRCMIHDREQSTLERRVSEAIRQANDAAEAASSAKMESERWRLQFEQVCTWTNKEASSTVVLPIAFCARA